jgi:hypothetical protein
MELLYIICFVSFNILSGLIPVGLITDSTLYNLRIGELQMYVEGVWKQGSEKEVWELKEQNNDENCMR